MITLDTSVWMNSVSSDEDGHLSSQHLFDYLVATRTKIIVPTILRVEMTSALARKGRRPAAVQEAIRRFTSFHFVDWIPVDERITDISCDIANAHRLRGADSIFAAIALDYRCNLVSLDKEHLTRLKTLLEVWTPDQAMEELKREAL